MVLKLHNSLTREIEVFTPHNDNTVTLYTCGPTVYNVPHIGNYRAYLFTDILKRTLLYFGYNVTHVMNMTDVDDKTIRDAHTAQMSLRDFTDQYIKAFYIDRDMLGMMPATQYTRATDYIEQMVTLIEQLLANNHAYTTEDGSVYFRLSSFPAYGNLAHIKINALENNASGRIATDEYEKDNPQDFALWKAWDATDGDVFWDTRLGRGRPGWHIECSAMSMSTLGETIDIHTGGIDNMFPHHENEIAQSECATGHTFVHYWMHNEWLLVDGKKMSKSLGNFYTLADIIDAGYDPIAFRYLTLQTHYRTPLNFSWESLKASQTALRRLRAYYQSLPPGAFSNDNIYAHKFHAALADDLNTSLALGTLWELIADTTVSPEDKHGLLTRFDEVLGINLAHRDSIPDTILSLADERDLARQNKNWAESDRIRDLIASHGFIVKDTDSGYRIEKK